MCKVGLFKKLDFLGENVPIFGCPKIFLVTLFFLKNSLNIFLQVKLFVDNEILFHKNFFEGCMLSSMNQIFIKGRERK